MSDYISVAPRADFHLHPACGGEAAISDTPHADGLPWLNGRAPEGWPGWISAKPAGIRHKNRRRIPLPPGGPRLTPRQASPTLDLEGIVRLSLPGRPPSTASATPRSRASSCACWSCRRRSKPPSWPTPVTRSSIPRSSSSSPIGARPATRTGSIAWLPISAGAIRSLGQTMGLHPSPTS